METKILQVSEIVFDEELYPRQNFDWQTALRYSESMKSGATFPPILVAEYAGKYYLADGKHRIEAKKNLKQTHIDCEVEKVSSKNEIYVMAIKANINHGRQLSTFDRAKIIGRLRAMDFTDAQVSAIVNIPIGKISSFVANRITNSINGEEVVLKAPVKVFAGEQVSEQLVVGQNVFAARSQEQIISELIVLLENDAINFRNPVLVNKMKIIYRLIREKVLLSRNRRK